MVERQVLESVDPLGNKIWITYDGGKKVALTRHFVHPFNPNCVYETRDYTTGELLSTTQAYPDIVYPGAKLFKTTDPTGKEIAETRHIKEPLNPEGVYKTWIFSGGTGETRHTPFALNPPGITTSTEEEIPYGVGVIAFEGTPEKILEKGGKKKSSLSNNESTAYDTIDEILNHDQQFFSVNNQLELEAKARSLPRNLPPSRPDEFIHTSVLKINYPGLIGGALFFGVLGFCSSLPLILVGSIPVMVAEGLGIINDADAVFNAMVYVPTGIGIVVGAMQGGFSSGTKYIKNPEYEKYKTSQTLLDGNE